MDEAGAKRTMNEASRGCGTEDTPKYNGRFRGVLGGRLAGEVGPKGSGARVFRRTSRRGPRREISRCPGQAARTSPKPIPKICQWLIGT